MQSSVSWSAIGSMMVLAALAPFSGLAGPVLTEPECQVVKIGGKLPLPCTMPLADYEKILYQWINNREYTKLGWVRDEYVRDTGPFILGANYGTHPAVRIYYSSEVITWVKWE